MNCAVELKSVFKFFGEHAAVNDVSLNVPEGSITGLIGPNGAGKSTLLKLLVGLSRPSSGSIKLLGTSLCDIDEKKRQQVIYVSADAEMYGSFRVGQILDFAKTLYEQWDESRRTVLVRALELPLDMRIRDLSLGKTMQLRLALALCARPRLLILDEPANGLDPAVKHQFMQLILADTNKNETSVLMATHRLEDVEMIADQVALMFDGKLRKTESMDDLKHDIKEVRAFIPSGAFLPEVDIPNVLRVKSKNSFVSLAVEGETDSVISLLQTSGLTDINVVDLEFNEMFRALMEKEGYMHDQIVLS